MTLPDPSARSLGLQQGHVPIMCPFSIPFWTRCDDMSTPWTCSRNQSTSTASLTAFGFALTSNREQIAQAPTLDENITRNLKELGYGR